MPNMDVKELGIDLIEIKRFSAAKNNRQNKFLLNNYSQKELDYCFSFKNSGPHLAGTWAAKEAVFKILGRDDILFSSIEIRRRKNGQPTIWLSNHQQKSIAVSISHTAKLAIAIALKK